MGSIAGVGYYQNRRASTKWREYLFVIGAGAMGAGPGLLCDLLTSTISLEYFVFGKGLTAGDGLRLRAGALGMKAGFSAGAIAGAVLLYVWTRRHLLLAGDCRRLIGSGCILLAGATLCAVVFGIAFSSFDALDFGASLKGILEESQIKRFLTVWWIHLGAYTGAVLGLVLAIVDMVRKKKSRADAYLNQTGSD